ncbi:uncharacterized protein LOC124935730 [Impatiens glandulifera]|uniref:uncharacterized protein LOC124935730 n=1 Tax=Impatiens glandulifera TaxID=253017 RepID=UPI001FB0D67F|nr:uncharacterized protein LOC124935730 [Impatiens glandulifera]
MATLHPLLSTHLFLTPLSSSPHKLHIISPSRFSFTVRSSADDSDETQPTDSDPSSSSDPDSFDNKLSQIRLRYRSGSGKKAEIRKSRKGQKSSSSSSSSSSGKLFLPPVPLKEPNSGGLKVDFGFSSYSERVNGRLAIVGLLALVLVELATGKGVINYHKPSVVLLQLYFMAAASALYLKYEKEKVSVWPESDQK